MLQGIVNSLPYGADHTQILAMLDVPDVRMLLEDEAGFYAIVIGSPPGIHHTAYISSSIICFEAECCSVRVPSVQKGHSSTLYTGIHLHSGTP